MNSFEAVGICAVIFAAAFGTCVVIYLAWLGAREVLGRTVVVESADARTPQSIADEIVKNARAYTNVAQR